MSQGNYPPPGGYPPGGAPPGAPGGYGPPPGGAPPGGYGPPPGGAPPGGAPPGGYGPPPGGAPPGAPGGYGPPPGAPQGQPYAGAPGAPGGPGYGGAPGAAPKKKGSAGMIVGIVGGVVVLGGLVVGGIMLLGGGKSPPLPVPVGNLPEKTVQVMRSTFATKVADGTQLREGDVPDQARWSSAAAQACGGLDVFRAAIHSDDEYGRKDFSKAMLYKADDHKKALECGKEVAAEMGKSAGVYAVYFEHDDKEKNVDLITMGLDKLPKSTGWSKGTTDASNMQETRCYLDWDQDEDADCEDSTQVWGKLDKADVWAGGSRDEVKAFGSKYSTDEGNKSSELEAMSELAAEFSDYRFVQVGLPKGYSVALAYLLDAHVLMLSGDEVDKLKEVIEENAETWAKASKGRTGERELRFVVQAKSESSAKDIKEALTDYLTKLKEKIDEADEEDDKKEQPDDMSTTSWEYRQSLQKVSRRAIKDGKVELDGKRVVLLVQEKPKESEQKKIDKFYDKQAKRTKYAINITDALLKGEAPKDKDIEKLGGEELVEAVEQAKAIAKGEWPFKPDEWSGASGFMVPGGGKHETISHKGDTIHLYVYKNLSLGKLLPIFRKTGEAAGWTLDMDDKGVYDCRKGGQHVRANLVSRGEGSAAMLLAF